MSDLTATSPSTQPFRALRVATRDGELRGALAALTLAELTPGDVVVRVEWSGINYKDALAVTGRGKILRREPLVAGIDLAGTVVASEDPRWSPGDAVLANGMGLGESIDGGFAELARLPGDVLLRRPPELGAVEAMALGTAGFTVALAFERFLANGLAAGAGDLVVTGASGGVGSLAVALATQLGHRVIAVSGRVELHGWLRELGAAETLTPAELALGERPLESGRFAAVLDNVGGELLAGLLRHVAPWGTVAVIGNAAGAEFSTTVYPFILRGVALVGVSSTNCPMPLRAELWRRLAGSWRPPHLERIANRRIGLAEIPAECTALLDRQRSGRTLVEVDR